LNATTAEALGDADDYIHQNRFIRPTKENLPIVELCYRAMISK
jgi:hypothetical protein